MSGHSKWSQIKRQKGVTDTKRGQIFTKISKVITLAVQQGGGVADPTQNFKLRLAVEKARSVNMPKDNIERAIKRAEGKLTAEVIETVYEGFTPGGVAVIVEAATDNKLRTNSEVKNVFDRNGGTFGVSGAVSYLFAQKGLITAKKENKDIDELFLLAADCGAEDVEDAGDHILIYTKPEELAKVKDELIKNNIAVEEFELTRQPVSTVAIASAEAAQKVLGFLEKLENLDDVQKVYANFDISDSLIS